MFKTLNNSGFSLVELMVVIVIVGILTIGVVMSFTDPIARVKAQALEIRGDFNLARGVAVRENEDVLMHFTLAATDGYQICFDDNDDGICNAADDEIIKTVTFRDEVQFYDFRSNSFPGNGPSKYPNGDAMTSPDDDGISFTNNNITFESNGASDKAGAVVIYFPDNNNPSKIRGKPYALVVASASSGKIELRRWRPEMSAGPPDERWSKK